MVLNHPEQELKRDLRGLASEIKWSAVELMRIAERLSSAGNEADAQAILRMCVVFQAGEDRLMGYAEDGLMGPIARLKAELARFRFAKLTVLHAQLTK